jgi:hypothetical protein
VTGHPNPPAPAARKVAPTAGTVAPTGGTVARSAAKVAPTGGEVAPTGRGERGSVAVLMCFIVLTGSTLAGFLVEAGTNIAAANRADTYSAEAARAAGIAVGPVPGSDAGSALRAAAAARSYLARVGAAGIVTVTGPATVTVSVTVTQASPILGLPVSQTRSHTAQLQIGVIAGQEAP